MSTSELYELLTKLKSTLFTQNQYNLVKQTATKQARKTVNLWKFKPEIRILFKMGKFQSYMMLLLGVTVLPFTLYQKYQQDNQKLTKILIFAPFGLAACLGPFILYKRFSKKLIESISYSFESKNLLLTRFKDGMDVEVKLSQITTVKSDRGKVKELVWNKSTQDNASIKSEQTSQNNKSKSQSLVMQKFQIQGLGEWQSVQLFNFITAESNKEHL